jgi:hypothetical protein
MNELMLPPPLTGRGGAPKTILDSSGTFCIRATSRLFHSPRGNVRDPP